MERIKKIDILFIIICIICGCNAFISFVNPAHQYMSIIGSVSLVLLTLFYISRIVNTLYLIPAILLLLFAISRLLPFIGYSYLSVYQISMFGFISYGALIIYELFTNSANYKDNNIFFWGLALGLLTQSVLRLLPDELGTYQSYAMYCNYIIIGMIGTIRFVPEKEPIYKKGIIEVMNIITVITIMNLLIGVSNMM